MEPKCIPYVCSKTSERLTAALPKVLAIPKKEVTTMKLNDRSPRSALELGRRREMKQGFMETIFMILAVMLLVAPAAQAAPVTIPGDFDAFKTEGPTSVDIPRMPVPGGPSFPEGFFGMKGVIPSDPILPPNPSDPDGIVTAFRIPLQGHPAGLPALLPQEIFDSVFFTTKWVDQHGNEVGPDSVHKVNQVQEPTCLPFPCNFDTVVRRTGDATFNGVGETQEVPIEIVALSLMSINPIEVTYGGAPSSFFDVFVTLSPGPQLTGKMGLISTSIGRGTVQGDLNLGAVGDLVDTTLDFSGPGAFGLPVNYRVMFVDRAGEIIINPVDALSVFHNPQNGDTFASVPEPSTWLMFGTGLLGLLGYGWRRRRRVT